ncbi:MAG: cell division protein FtsQ/DivIB [Candidatus Omnitrophota bacterium]
MAKKEKKSPRNTRKPRVRRRVFPLLDMVIRFMPCLFFIFIAVFLIKGVQHLLLHSDYFDIKRIEVMDRSQLKIETSVARDLYSHKGVNIFMLDIKKCEYDIERDYLEIRDVVIHRRLPDALFISYKLRRPVCQIESGSYYLVSDDAVIISQPLLSKQPVLMVVSGIDVSSKSFSGMRHEHKKRLQKAINIINDINDTAEGSCLTGDSMVKEVNVYDGDSPVLILDDGTRVELGTHQLKDKLDTIKKVLSDLSFRNRKAKIIDLRFEDIVVVPR